MYPTRKKRIYFLYLFCVYFCIYNLVELIEKKNRGFFKLNVIEPIRIPSLSVCLKINSTNLDCLTEQCRALRTLFEHIENRTIITPRQIIERSYRINLASFFSTNYGANSSVIFIKYGSICIKYFNDSTPDKTIGIKLHNHLNFTVQLYVHEQAYPEIYNNYLESIECTGNECTNFKLEVWKFKLKFIPVFEDCLHYGNESSRFNFENHERIISQEICIFECLKPNYRPTNFLYTKNDDEPLHLNLSASKLDQQRWISCAKVCKSMDCDSNYFLIKKYQRAAKTSIKINLHLSTNERYSLMEYDFRLQLFNFICLIFGTSMLSSLEKINDLLFAYGRNLRVNIHKAVWIIGWSLILFLLCSTLVRMPRDIKKLRINQTEKNFKFELERLFVPFELYLCFNLNPILKDHYLNDLGNELFEENYLDHLDLNDLLSLPFNVSDYIQQIYFDYGEIFTDIDVQVGRKTIYFKIYSNKTILKCLTYNIQLEEPEFKSLFPITTLKIKWKNNADFRIYFTDSERQLTSRNKEISISRSIVRNKFYLLNCRQYEHIHINGTELRCTDRRSCLDRCFNYLFFNEMSSLPPNVIVEDEFERFKRARLNFKKMAGADSLSSIRKRCKQMMIEKDCEKIEYLPASELDVEQRDNKIILNIFPDTNIHEEREFYYLNFRSLVSKLVTFFCVLLGVNFFDLIRLMKKLFHLNNRFKEIYLMKGICLFAMFIHLNAILRTVIYDSNFIENFSITKEMDIEDFPSPNFCFTNHYIEQNISYTGYEYDRLTSNISVSSFIESVHYLNDNMQLQAWYSNSTEHGRTNIEIIKYYFSDKKCFRLNYNPNRKMHSYVGALLVVRFRTNFHQNLYYFSSIKNLNSVNSFHRLEISKSYIVDTKQTSYRYYDNIQLFFKPILFFVDGYRYREPNTYVDQLRAEFKARKQHATTLLTLTESYNHLPINNSLFEDFFDHEFKTKLERFKDQNFKRIVYKDIILNNKNDNYSLYVKKVRYKRWYTMERKDSCVSFFCDLLSCVSLWLGFGMVDIIKKFVDSFLIKFVVKKLMFNCINFLIKISFLIVGLFEKFKQTENINPQTKIEVSIE